METFGGGKEKSQLDGRNKDIYTSRYTSQFLY